jgi:hypothetical protein
LATTGDPELAVDKACAAIRSASDEPKVSASRSTNGAAT